MTVEGLDPIERYLADQQHELVEELVEEMSGFDEHGVIDELGILDWLASCGLYLAKSDRVNIASVAYFEAVKASIEK